MSTYPTSTKREEGRRRVSEWVKGIKTKKQRNKRGKNKSVKERRKERNKKE
jgi:hypothetical protein